MDQNDNNDAEGKESSSRSGDDSDPSTTCSAGHCDTIDADVVAAPPPLPSTVRETTSSSSGAVTCSSASCGSVSVSVAISSVAAYSVESERVLSPAPEQAEPADDVSSEFGGSAAALAAAASATAGTSTGPGSGLRGPVNQSDDAVVDDREEGGAGLSSDRIACNENAENSGSKIPAEPEEVQESEDRNNNDNDLPPVKLPPMANSSGGPTNSFRRSSRGGEEVEESEPPPGNADLPSSDSENNLLVPVNLGFVPRSTTARGGSANSSSLGPGAFRICPLITSASDDATHASPMSATDDHDALASAGPPHPPHDAVITTATLVVEDHEEDEEAPARGQASASDLRDSNGDVSRSVVTISPEGPIVEAVKVEEKRFRVKLCGERGPTRTVHYGWTCAAICGLVIGLVTALCVTLLKGRGDNGSNEPAGPEDDFEMSRYDAMRALLSPSITADDGLFDDPATPQARALHWVANEDGANLSFTETDRIKQRYVLAVFFYSTNGDGWSDSLGFLSDAHECEWYTTEAGQSDFRKGVNACEAGYGALVSSLQVYWNNLTGTLPAELGRLPYLRMLQLGINGIGGQIPPELGDLTDLLELNLNDNAFVGTVPTELSGLSLLRSFASYSNPGLTGSLNFMCPLTETGQLTWFVSDCGGETPKVECSCCGHCCDRAGFCCDVVDAENCFDSTPVEPSEDPFGHRFAKIEHKNPMA